MISQFIVSVFYFFQLRKEARVKMCIRFKCMLFYKMSGLHMVWHQFCYHLSISRGSHVVLLMTKLITKSNRSPVAW
jgi:hypothetical protein